MYIKSRGKVNVLVVCMCNVHVHVHVYIHVYMHNVIVFHKISSCIERKKNCWYVPLVCCSRRPLVWMEQQSESETSKLAQDETDSLQPTYSTCTWECICVHVCVHTHVCVCMHARDSEQVVHHTDNKHFPNTQQCY